MQKALRLVFFAIFFAALRLCSHRDTTRRRKRMFPSNANRVLPQAMNDTQHANLSN
jgi:hypothetical protein